jgi:hypothetical protein
MAVSCEVLATSSSAGTGPSRGLQKHWHISKGRICGTFLKALDIDFSRGIYCLNHTWDLEISGIKGVPMGEFDHNRAVTFLKHKTL